MLTAQVLVFLLCTDFCFGANFSNHEDREGPLLLTPLLDAGNVELARVSSEVPDLLNRSSARSSHAGFFTTDEELGIHMFFWFFPAG